MSIKKVFDNNANCYYDFEIIKSELRGEATTHLLEGDIDKAFYQLIVVEYNDGDMFTQWDWQSPITEIPEDLSEIKWAYCRDGREGIMLDGLPRILI